jgi:pyrimidine operon attenuation protein/uracil phosphoribosyltransferase
MESGKEILSPLRIQLTLERLCHQILEKGSGNMPLCLVGIQERGVFFAARVVETMKSIYPEVSFEYGKLDISFYRDDYRRRENPIRVSSMEMDFLVENKRVILIDDVLYTGRTVHAAMSALLDFGRPATIEMLCLVDRRFNRQFPIKCDYVGETIDSLDEAFVKVIWDSQNKNHKVLLFSGTPQPNQS